MKKFFAVVLASLIASLGWSKELDQAGKMYLPGPAFSDSGHFVFNQPWDSIHYNVRQWVAKRENDTLYLKIWKFEGKVEKWNLEKYEIGTSFVLRSFPKLDLETEGDSIVRFEAENQTIPGILLKPGRGFVEIGIAATEPDTLFPEYPDTALGDPNKIGYVDCGAVSFGDTTTLIGIDDNYHDFRMYLMQTWAKGGRAFVRIWDLEKELPEDSLVGFCIGNQVVRMSERPRFEMLINTVDCWFEIEGHRINDITFSPGGGPVQIACKPITLVGVEATKEPEHVLQIQNYPNPFSHTAVIHYQIPIAKYVSLRVYDASGRLVRTLVDSKITAGQHNVSLHSKEMTNGIYFCRLKVGNYIATKKLTLLR